MVGVARTPSTEERAATRQSAEPVLTGVRNFRDVGGLPGADGLRVGLAEGRTADRMTASYRVRIYRRRGLSAALNLITDTLDRLRDRVLL